MAQFKIYLLNLRANDSEFTPRYSAMPISEFNSVYDIHQTSTDHTFKFASAQLKQDINFCYTYNEKFKISKNYQRTLSFSMNRTVIRADRIEKNPFINYLFIGAQILLVDRYNNHHLMTVNKIDYDFKELNTVFSYDCSDSFNYQLSRQNDGYEIVNNSDDIDFIGAKDLDWWVMCKIHPECKISYRYLKLDQKLMIDGHIVKTPYNTNQHHEFYKTVPFSGSGTADSVLVALGELYGLQLKVYERFNFDTGELDKYYWFESTKSLTPTGLKYSPHVDLQSFKLTHNGQSFSSVLNIQNHSIGDEMITVIPEVPNFFRQWFETSEWEKSHFIPGLFTSACKEEVEILTYSSMQISSSKYNSSEKILRIPVADKLPNFKYDYISFTTTNKSYSTFSITNGSVDKPPLSYCSKYDNWKVEIVCSVKDKKSGEISSKKHILFSNEDIIPHSLWQEWDVLSTTVNLLIPCDLDVSNSIVLNGEIYYTLFRIPSSEELEFANIADQIPWLENKLISFNYFREHAIINNAEHHALMQILENDLRKVNAKLLLYSQMYYKDIQEKTKIISDLSAKIDTVGAIFNADLIAPFESQGKSTQTTEMQLALSDLFRSSSESTNLILYYETLTDYVNKYISAEQTFLKNMYLFRNYFDSFTNFGSLHQYLFTLPEQTGELRITFSSNKQKVGTTLSGENYNNFIKLTKEMAHYPIFQKQDNVYVPIDKNNIITSDNYIYDYYYLNSSSEKVVIDNSNVKQYEHYNKDQIYYERQWKIKHKTLYDAINNTNSKQLVCSHPNISDNKFLCTLEDDYVIIQCWQHCLHSTECPIVLKSDDDNISYSINDPEVIYTRVTYAEMRNNYIYQTIKNKSTELWRLNPYTTIDIPKKSVEKWPSSFNETYLTMDSLLLLADSKNWDEDDLKEDDPETWDNIYKRYLPVSRYYWYGKADDLPDTKDEYHETSFVNGENYMTFARKISVSTKTRKNWRIAKGIMQLPIINLVWVAWRNGTKGFGLDGWTYHDIFNCDFKKPFQGWTDSTRLMYVTNEDGYNETAQRDVFDSKCFSGKESWLNDNGDKCVYEQDEKKENHKIIKWGYNEAQNILFTYFSLQKRFEKGKNPYYYTTSYWRVLSGDEVISKNDSLLMLPQPSSDDSNFSCFNLLGLIEPDNSLASRDAVKLNGKTHYRLDSTIFYPLQNMVYDVTSSDFAWPDQDKTATLSYLVSKTYSDWKIDKSGLLWTGTIDIDELGQQGSIIFLKEENYDYDVLKSHRWSSNDIFYDSLFELATRSFYRCESMLPINLLTEVGDLTKGFFVNKDTEEYIPTKDLTEFDEDTQYYSQINGVFERRYTLKQLVDKGDMYVRPNTSYEYMTFNSDLDSINVLYQVYKQIQENDGIRYQLMGTQQGKILKNEAGLWLLSGDNVSIYFNDQDISHTTQTLSNLTNGAFWNKYRNSASTVLMEKAMLIETNLTEYWTNAYYASKNCRFFIPQYWQPTINQKQNYFSPSVVDLSTEKATVLPLYVPHVKQQINQDWYQFKHIDIAAKTSDMTTYTNDLRFNQSTLLSAVINEVPSLKQIFTYLNLPASEWVTTKTEESHVLYTYESGGMTWQQALKTLSNNAISSDAFGGWYDMMIRVLLSCNYVDYKPLQYYQAQEEHDYIWSKIYTKYPNLLYEKAFKNEDATTSAELLQLAQYAFRDYNQPESNYNISVIDLHTLYGYHGQELKIGDGITIEANELYDDHQSDIYQSLIQYLYITDISYDLRKDDGVQLTVNPIKYQDKVIGQLVKLIR